jgi:hypothetical protein
LTEMHVEKDATFPNATKNTKETIDELINSLE